jgi:hypothetical protein
LEEEMARFTMRLKREHASVRFVALTRSDTSGLRAAFARLGLPTSDLIIQSCTPDQMPVTLPAGDLGLSFIQSCFSKLGSSPTKVAEYLAAGMPVVVNGDIGDQGELSHAGKSCIVLSDFSNESLDAATEPALHMAKVAFAVRKRATRLAALKYFGLANIGVPRYVALYEALASGVVA